MEVIRDCEGNVISQSKNLAGIRRYVGKHTIKWLAIDTIGKNGLEGKLMILFGDGSSFETNFASYTVLKIWIRNWRNVYGAPLLVNGRPKGIVEYYNPSLM